MRVLALVLVLMVAGCLSPTPASPEGTDVQRRTLAMGAYSGVTEPVREVFDSESEWAAFWSRHASTQIPEPPPPEVDFETERVIAVAIGQKGDGCWSVEIDPVVKTGDEIVAVVTTYDAHQAGSVCTAALTQPHHFIAIRDRDARVRFDERLDTANSGAPSPTPGSPPPEESAPEALSLRAIDRGAQSSAPATRTLVRDEATWRELWAQHVEGRVPAPEAPAVEWGNESVIAVVLDPKPDGCWSVDFGNVTYDGTKIRVEVDVHEPPADAFCASVVTRAFVFAAVPSRPGNPEFVDV